MRKEDYRAEVDAVPFDPGFQERTVARLTELARKKEQKPMKQKRTRTGLAAAAVAAALTVTACAAVAMLRPQDVARHTGDEALAAAFESGDAVTVNESRRVGDYEVTFLGLVSGEGLSRTEHMPDGAERDRSYAVLAYARADGAAIEDDVPELTVSPLVEGYAPWRVNAWTLNGSAATFAQDGMLYYLLECDSVEPFADRRVYLAVYPGSHMPPDAGMFTFDGDTGAIGVQEGGEAVLFTLPLDSAKADPEKAGAIVAAVFGEAPEESGDPEELIDDGVEESRQLLIAGGQN